MQLSPDQENAATAFLEFLTDDTKNEVVLCGEAGTGKSFMTKHFISLLRQNKKVMKLLIGDAVELPIYYTASTNKAASVLSDMVHSEATTIHSLIGLRVTNDYKTGKTKLTRGGNYKILEDALLIIDECSYINDRLLQEIRDATLRCKVLYIGDDYQLAPVLESHCPVFDIPNKIRLVTPHRQDADSPIITLARMFRATIDSNKFPPINSSGTDVQLVKGAAFQAAIDKTYMAGTNARILAWSNKRVHQYNEHVRAMLGHPAAYDIGEQLVVNSPIMVQEQCKKSVDSIVTITDCEPAVSHVIAGQNLELDGELTVFLATDRAEVNALIKRTAKTKDWTTYFKYKDHFVDLRPTHACTVFKAQGSTYGTVFIDVNDMGRCTKRSQVARMLLVAISRATYRVYLHGTLPTRFYAN